jgi:hypothetical protein
MTLVSVSFAALIGPSIMSLHGDFARAAKGEDGDATAGAEGASASAASNSEAYNIVFYIFAGIAAVGVAATLLMKPYRPSARASPSLIVATDENTR